MPIAKLAHKIANIGFIKRFLTENRYFVRFYFDWRYRNEDPYDVSTSEYEQEKTTATLSAMEMKEKYENILEIGCGEGYFTRRLTARAERVLGVDISGAVIKRAGDRLRPFANIELRRFDILSDDIDETFELIIASEVLYYINPPQLPEAVAKIKSWIASGGYMLLVHVRALADDDAGVELKKFGAKTIHELFTNDEDFETVTDDIRPEYRITVVRKKS